MALINCPECSKEVSEQAKICPNCGIAIKPKVKGNISQKILIVSMAIVVIISISVIGIFVGNQIHKNNIEQERIATEEAMAQAAIIKDQRAYDTAKESYELLCIVADDTISMMNSIYGAWYFGIYKYKDALNKLSEFSTNVGLSEKDISTAMETLDITTYYLSEFSICILIVQSVFTQNGKYESVKDNILSANELLKTMTAEYDDYKHYPMLKEFYSKVSSYASFAENPTGSFQQLKDTINDYENSIRTYRTDLGFIFE